MLSPNLEQSLHRALALANERRHEYATLEHLLLALSEDTDAIAVVAPCVVEHVRLRSSGRQLGAKSFAEREPFKIEPDIDGKPFAVRPIASVVAPKS